MKLTARRSKNLVNQYEVVCEYGSCLLTIYHNGMAKVGIIDDVKVDKNHRRKGVGTAIMKTAIDWAKYHDVDSLELVVNLDNTAARELYKKLGFEETTKKYCRMILNRFDL